MSTETTEASRGTAVGFITITFFGIAAAIAIMLWGASVQPLGAAAEQPPAVTAPVTEEPSEPVAEEPKPQPSAEPSTAPTAEPQPAEPVDLGAPVTPLGIALVEEFGAGTTFWHDGEQVRDPEQGDRLRTAYRSDVTLDQLVSFWVGTDAYWLRVVSNSEANGLEVEIKE